MLRIILSRILYISLDVHRILYRILYMILYRSLYRILLTGLSIAFVIGLARGFWIGIFIGFSVEAAQCQVYAPERDITAIYIHRIRFSIGCSVGFFV